MEIRKALVEPYRNRSSTSPDAGPVVINAVLRPDNLPVQVIYTSPTYQRYFYGMFAPPAVGSEILITYDKDKDEYYYISTIVDHALDLGIISKDSEGNSAPLFREYKAYDDEGRPTAMFFKNEKNAGLKITNYYVSGDPVINEVQVKSSKGSKLILSDSPAAECVVLRNSEGDGITIGGDINIPFIPKFDFIHRGIVFNSLMGQQSIVTNGSYEVSITDGRDVTIKNDSKGTFRAYKADAQNIGLADPEYQYGNINLVSKYRDINIYTDNPAPASGLRESSVYVTTQYGVIQIKSGGGVTIFNLDPTKKITVQSAGGIDLLAESGDINIRANAGNVNISSQASTNIVANTNLNAAGNTATNIGISSPLNLNSGVPITAISPTRVQPKLNVKGK
jgi:hypothetical protein